MNLLIGIAGRAGAGKDTAGIILSKNLSYQRIAFADPIRAAVKAMLSLDNDALLTDRDLKEAEIDYLGKSPRQIMQLLGTEYGRKMIHQDIWITIGMRKAQKSLLLNGVAFTDVRFDNEAEAIKKAGGFVIEIVRDGVSSVASHVSEAGVNDSLIDLIIYNNGDCKALQDKMVSAIGYLETLTHATNNGVVIQPSY